MTGRKSHLQNINLNFVTLYEYIPFNRSTLSPKKMARAMWLHQIFPRRGQRELAVLDPFGADEFIRDAPDILALPTDHKDFQAVVRIKMHVL